MKPLALSSLHVSLNGNHSCWCFSLFSPPCDYSHSVTLKLIIRSLVSIITVRMHKWNTSVYCFPLFSSPHQVVSAHSYMYKCTVYTIIHAHVCTPIWFPLWSHYALSLTDTVPWGKPSLFSPFTVSFYIKLNTCTLRACTWWEAIL